MRLHFYSFMLVCVFSLLCSQAICLAKDQPVTKNAVDVSTPYGHFVFNTISITPDGTVSGSVLNNTSRDWRQAWFHVYLKDKKGQTVPMFKGGRVSYTLNVIVSNLHKGQAGNFTSRVEFPLLPPPDKFTDFFLDFDDPNSKFNLEYVFNLITPRENSSPAFSDDTISIIFRPSNQQIAFQLQNRTMYPITLNWDQMSYVDFDGSSHRIIHEGVRFIQRNAPQPQTVIPPSANITDFLYPADRVEWGSSQGINAWLEHPMWPFIPYAGQKFAVFMPIEVNGIVKNYLFTVKVAEVRY